MDNRTNSKSEPSYMGLLFSQQPSLPEPDDQASALSGELVLRIKEKCRQSGGRIPFSQYMQMALYEPGLGYYSSGRQKFGERGDFITAPEVSSLFSRCLARQASDVLNQVIDDRLKTSVLELGAGSGIMAADILLELERTGGLPDEYMILELSGELRQRQKRTLEEKAPTVLNRVRWLDELPKEPFNGIVLANEVLDAMPVECFRISEGGIETLVVGVEEEKLVAEYAPADPAVREKVETIENRLAETRNNKLPLEYCSEYNPSIQPWLDAIHRVLNRGAMVLIDYGYPVHEYYHEDRSAGTMMCHYQHRAHANPLWYPGLQDITAFVDFTDVAYCAVAAGFNINGYTTQASFLVGCGIEELYQSQFSDDIKEQVVLSQHIKTLTLPSEMGERFKVMALTKNLDVPLAGFIVQDMRNRL